MDLEVLLQLADGRAPAEVGDGVAPAAVDHRAHGIDAEARPEMLAQRHVGGGKADGAAALVAQLDRALDLPGMAQQLRGFAGPAVAPGLADAGRGIDLALVHHRIEHGDAKGLAMALLAQHLDIAAAARTESE